MFLSCTEKIFPVIGTAIPYKKVQLSVFDTKITILPNYFSTACDSIIKAYFHLKISTWPTELPTEAYLRYFTLKKIEWIKCLKGFFISNSTIHMNKSIYVNVNYVIFSIWLRIHQTPIILKLAYICYFTSFYVIGYEPDAIFQIFEIDVLKKFWLYGPMVLGNYYSKAYLSEYKSKIIIEILL